MRTNQPSKKRNSTPFISKTELMKYAAKIVCRYIYQGTIPEREEENVKMSIVGDFWEKQDIIAARFSGKAKISTYCIAILNRMCCELIRKNSMDWKSKPEEFARGKKLQYICRPEKLILQGETLMLDKFIRILHE
ncbi:MAG: hypothetical protein ACQESJ_08540 [Bacteroidota bacterium]